MWMIAPTPETRTAIVLLNGSSVSPSGTWKIPLIVIHVNSAAAMVECAKIKQLHVKLTSTAAIEIELLTLFHRRVNSVMTTVLISGAIRVIHGKVEFMGWLACSELQAANVFDVRRLSRAIECDKNGKADCYFSSCDCDDKKDKHLRAVIWQTVWIDAESREGHERQICRIQHQFQRHEDDDEIASQHHSGKPN